VGGWVAEVELPVGRVICERVSSRSVTLTNLLFTHTLSIPWSVTIVRGQN